MKRLMTILAAAVASLSAGLVTGYPLDGYPETGITRVAAELLE